MWVDLHINKAFWILILINNLKKLTVAMSEKHYSCNSYVIEKKEIKKQESLFLTKSLNEH